MIKLFIQVLNHRYFLYNQIYLYMIYVKILLLDFDIHSLSFNLTSLSYWINSFPSLTLSSNFGMCVGLLNMIANFYLRRFYFLVISFVHRNPYLIFFDDKLIDHWRLKATTSFSLSYPKRPY